MLILSAYLVRISDFSLNSEFVSESDIFIFFVLFCFVFFRTQIFFSLFFSTIYIYRFSNMRLSQITPSKFMGCLPLYVGVEVVLGFAILNKMSGAYGILSLITGHPINIVQWVYYLFSLAIVPFYISALRSLSKPRPGVFSLATCLYALDTFTSILFTIYFSYFWWVHESSDAPPVEVIGDNDSFGVAKRLDGVDLTSQSASNAYEIFLTVVSTVGVNVLRSYFTLVLVAFTMRLIKASRNEEFQDLGSVQGKFQIWRHKMESRALDFCRTLA